MRTTDHLASDHLFFFSQLCVASADELLHVTTQACEPVRACMLAVLRAAAGAVGMEVFGDEHDLKAMGMVGLLVGPTKKKARIETKATKRAAKKDAFPHSKIIDVLCSAASSSA